MLGFHTEMKSRLLSSTSDVAHLFGMTVFFSGLHQISLRLCVSFCLLDWGYELMSVGSDGMTCVLYITDVTDNNNNTRSISSFLRGAK